MSALFNTDIKRGIIVPLYAGFIPCVLPELPIGGTVEYVYASDKQWFTLHATYNRKNKACDFIMKDKQRFIFRIIKSDFRVVEEKIVTVASQQRCGSRNQMLIFDCNRLYTIRFTTCRTNK